MEKNNFAEILTPLQEKELADLADRTETKIAERVAIDFLINRMPYNSSTNSNKDKYLVEATLHHLGLVSNIQTTELMKRINYSYDTLRTAQSDYLAHLQKVEKDQV